MDPVSQFKHEKSARIASYGSDESFNRLSQDWLRESMARQYVYNFEWLGRPIIQYPSDIIAVQELIWSVRPDLIIETGIAHGGSLILSASLLALLDLCDAAETGELLDPQAPKRMVIGVDIDIRSHNRAALEAHPLANRFNLILGSSIDPQIVSSVREIAQKYNRIMVFLDSMHTQDHVLAELEAYAGLVSSGSYCVVFDTFVEDMPKGFFLSRPWDVGNNPKTAVHKFLAKHDEFELDLELQRKLQVTVAPDGFLRRR
ncbi:cephalosporin hydroxylase family protein [Flaviflagellibacter deserti]|uniref:Cephalosporin hydroxylase family protein n=1 Tax=Flaviflagellibacter deserti TaxID=2267266 RepID=A0ABV9Z2Q3_9HYPH